MVSLDSLLNTQAAHCCPDGFAHMHEKLEKGRRKITPASRTLLLAQSQFGDNGAVPLNIGFHQIVEQVTTMADHFQKAASGMMILLMDLQVLGEVSNSLGENGDLYLGRTSVLLVQSVCFDYSCFFFFQQHVLVSPLFKIGAPKRLWDPSAFPPLNLRTGCGDVSLPKSAIPLSEAEWKMGQCIVGYTRLIIIAGKIPVVKGFFLKMAEKYPFGYIAR